MSTSPTSIKDLRVIFYVQIGLLVIMAILTFLGYTFKGITVGAFWFAMIMGAIGASISLLRRIYKFDMEIADQDKSFKALTILIPILYGTVLAGVAYLLFMSNILSGENGNGLIVTNLFPNFTNPANTEEDLLRQFVNMKPASMQDTGKLLVWCFIAGYSERFVMGIVGQLEGKSGSSN